MKIARLIGVIILSIMARSVLYADGLIVVRPVRPVPVAVSPYALQVRSHVVDVRISERSTITTIDQVFHNPTNYRLEGDYLFPLPAGASISSFSMDINGRMTKAELLDAAKAGKIYTDIVRRMKDPALMEYQGRGLFRTRIYPIEPKSDKRVRIVYRELLDEENGLLAYRYPLNTEKFSSAPLEKVRIDVSIESHRVINTVYSPSQKISVEGTGSKKAGVTYEDRNVLPDRDFILYMGLAGKESPMSILTHGVGGQGFFMLQLSAPSEKQKVIPKDIVFVMDTSGSMAGAKISQAREALSFMVEHLKDDDRFQIISFGTEVNSLFRKVVGAGKKHKKAALDFIKGIEALGGTCIDEALEKAVQSFDSSSRPRYVLFVTDGRPTIGERNTEKIISRAIKNNGSDTRIFTVGIGHDVNTGLLDGLALRNGALSSYIAEEEDLELKLSSLYQQISSPVLTDLDIRAEGPVRLSYLHPKPFPDLFSGQTILVLGRFTGTGKASIILKGSSRGKIHVFKEELDFSKTNNNDFIPQLWAARHVAWLLEEIRQKGESEELKNEIVSLARTYGIVTPYTSYLILEDEAGQPPVHAEERISRTVVPDASGAKKSYMGMKEKSGRDSVLASRAIQKMKDESSDRTYRSADVKIAGGRAFYYNGAIWIDSRLKDIKVRKIVKIFFGSEEYFSMAGQDREIVSVLSLGRRIRFAYRGRIYEIMDKE